MATVLANNLISNIPFVLTNAEGAPVALPANGGKVSLDVATAGVVEMGTDNASVDFVPNRSPEQDGVNIVITLTVTNMDGSTVDVVGNYTVGAAIVADLKVTAGTFTDTAITTRPLA